MPANGLDQRTYDILIESQKNEITEYYIYNKLAKVEKNEKNSELLREIAEDEKEHYDFWKKYTNKEVKANRIKIFFYYWLARIFGVMFGIKLMESGEEDAQEVYKKVAKTIPSAQKIVDDEDKHEDELINLIDEERLKYIGSVVLGLNDALVELTGTLAGLTFALQNTNIIALSGMITGIAAAFSMAASEYLSTKQEEGEKHELKSSAYTGVAYILTVILLIIPYFIFSHYLVCLAATIIMAVLIILVFNFYISVARDLNFKKRFLEMATISLGVSFFSFIIGIIIRAVFGVDI
ncbi:MAG: VIT1/CCC1 transporter family protein [Bacillota bacterium]